MNQIYIEDWAINVVWYIQMPLQLLTKSDVVCCLALPLLLLLKHSARIESTAIIFIFQSIYTQIIRKPIFFFNFTYFLWHSRTNTPVSKVIRIKKSYNKIATSKVKREKNCPTIFYNYFQLQIKYFVLMSFVFEWLLLWLYKFSALLFTLLFSSALFVFVHFFSRFIYYYQHQWTLFCICKCFTVVVVVSFWIATLNNSHVFVIAFLRTCALTAANVVVRVYWNFFFCFVCFAFGKICYFFRWCEWSREIVLNIISAKRVHEYQNQSVQSIGTWATE